MEPTKRSQHFKRKKKPSNMLCMRRIADSEVKRAFNTHFTHSHPQLISLLCHSRAKRKKNNNEMRIGTSALYTNLFAFDISPLPSHSIACKRSITRSFIYIASLGIYIELCHILFINKWATSSISHQTNTNKYGDYYTIPLLFGLCAP